MPRGQCGDGMPWIWRLPKTCEGCHGKGHILMFGAYFSLRQDIWFLEIASSLPKVLTANGKFACFEHISALGSISGFWRLLAAFQKWSQQTQNSYVWSIFWHSAGYLAFGGCSQPSNSGHSKDKFSCVVAFGRISGFWRLLAAFQKWSQQGQILMFGVYFGNRLDFWVLERFNGDFATDILKK